MAKNTPQEPHKDFLYNYSKSEKENLDAYNAKYGTNYTHVIYSSNEPLDNSKYDRNAPRHPISMVDSEGKVVKEFQRVPTVRLNEMTGQIEIHGPGRIINSPLFRQKYENILTDISRSYQVDPTAKVPVLSPTGEQTGQTQSILQLVDSFNIDDMNNAMTMARTARDFAAIDSIKKQDSERFGLDIDIRDEDMVTRTAIVMDIPGGEKPRDTERQAVSDAIGQEFLNLLKTYDPTTGTAEYGDIKEHLWNRELGISDERLLAMRQRVRDRLVANEYKDTPEGSSQAAHDIAFLTFLEGEQAETGVVRSVVESAGQLLEGAWYSLGENFAGVAGLAETVSDGIRGTLADVADSLFGVESGVGGREYASASELFPFEGAPGLLVNLPGIATALTKGPDGKLAIRRDKIEENTWGDVILPAIRDHHALRDEEQSLLPSAAKTMDDVGAFVVDLAAMLLASKVAGAAVKGVAGGITAGATKIAGGLGKAATTAKAVDTAVDVAQTATKVSNIAKGLTILGTGTGKAITFTANIVAKFMTSKAGALATDSMRILAESLTEAMILEPDLSRKVLTDKNLTPEARNYLLQSIAENTGGEVVAFGAGKALTKLGNTTLGRAVSANASRNINKVLSWSGEKKAKLRCLLHHVDNLDEYAHNLDLTGKNRKIKKAQAMRANYARLKARKGLSNARAIKILGRDFDDINDQLQKHGEELYHYFVQENCLDDMARGYLGYINKITTTDAFPEFKAANDEFSERHTKLMELEKERGLKPREIVDKETGKVVGYRLLSKDTINYVESKGRVSFLDNYIEKFDKVPRDIDPDTVKGRGVGQYHYKTNDPNIQSKVREAKRERDYWKEFQAKYEVQYGSEMTMAANDLAETRARWNRAFTDLEVAEFVVDARSVNSLRASGLWGEDGIDYVHTQRIYEKPNMTDEFMIYRNDGRVTRDTVLDFEHYKIGSTEDFEDPLFVMTQQMREAAEIHHRSEIARGLIATDAVNNRVVMNSDDVNLASDYKAKRTAYERSMDARMDEIVTQASELGDELTTGDLGHMQAKVTASGAQLHATEQNLNLQRSKLESLNSGKVKPASTAYRKELVGRLTNEEVDDVWDEVVGEPTANILERALADDGDCPQRVRQFIHDTYNDRHSVIVNNIKRTGIDEYFGPDDDALTIIDEALGENADALDATQIRSALVDYIGKEQADNLLNAIKKEKKLAFIDTKKLPKLNRDDFYRYSSNMAKPVRRTKLPKGVISENDKYFAGAVGKTPREFGRSPVEKFLSDDGVRLGDQDQLDAVFGHLKNEVHTIANQGEIGEEIFVDLPKHAYKDEVINYYYRAAYQTNPNNVSAADIHEYLGRKNYDVKVKRGRKGVVQAAEESKLIPNSNKVTFDHYRELAKYDDTIDSDLKRMFLSDNGRKGNPDLPDRTPLYDSDKFKAYADNYLAEEHAAEWQELYDNASEEFDDALNLYQGNLDDLNEQCDKMYDGFVMATRADESVQSYAKLLADNFAPGMEGEIADYIALESFEKNRSKFREKLNERIRVQLKSAVTEEMGKTIDFDKISRSLANRICAKFDVQFAYKKADMSKLCREAIDNKSISKEIADAVEEIEGDKIAKATADVSGEIVRDPNSIVDSVDEAIQGKVSKLQEKLTELRSKSSANHVVGFVNSEGKYEYVELDPMIASLVKETDRLTPMSGLEQFNFVWAKLFRTGTTSLSLTSMINQTFRDPLNAFTSAGVTKTTGQCFNEVLRHVAPNAAEFVERESPELFELVTKGEMTAQDAAKKLLKDSMDVGKAVAPTATETALYKRGAEGVQGIIDAKYHRRGGGMPITVERFSNGVDKIADAFGMPNGVRESKLRIASYNNAFADGIKAGYDRKTAEAYATFIQSNATTNFSQSMEHLAGLQRSVPYLGAAVNASKSFYRLAVLDPVGVTGRLLGGIALPVVYLTAQSLGSEENREIWRNIPEYQKDDNLIFVANGEVFSVPLPQETTPFINFFRHMVEKTYDANPHAFWELATSDLVGLSPVDMSGFVNIDRNRMFEETNVLANVNTGLLKIWSQVAPVPLKAAAMAISGIDPFTGRAIDTSYEVMDFDTGQAVPMDTRTGEFARGLSDLSGVMGWHLNAPMAEAITRNIVGNAGVEALDWITTLLNECTGREGAKTGDSGRFILNQLAEDATKPLTVDVYNQANQDWFAAVKRLKAEKDEILESDAYSQYMTAVRKAHESGDEDEIEKLRFTRKQIFHDYFESIHIVVNNYRTKYNGNFDSSKVASVLTLMTLDNTTGDYSEVRGQELLGELFFDARQRAVGTMVEMGFPDADGEESLLGYYKYNPETGGYDIKFRDPLYLSSIKNELWYSKETHISNLKKILEERGINRGAMFRDYKNMTKEEKAEFKRLWNTKVIYALYPYVQKYGVQSIMDDYETRDFIQDYIFVDNPYQAKAFLIEAFGD